MTYAAQHSEGQESSVSERTALNWLLDELSRLPGIGYKSAQRIAYHLLQSDDAEVARLIEALSEVKRSIHFCPTCFSYATGDTCAICADATRDHTTICVVADPRDVEAFERLHTYRGVYHVLGGQLAPMDGITPADLRIRELMARLASDEVQEIILATNLDVEGEATAAYIARELKPFGLKVTRLASGLPLGGDLEYADEGTLERALEARREL